MEEIKILFEDKHLTVCVKPPRLLSQQDQHNSPNMLDALKDQTGIEHKCLHRLDLGVGGTMVYAKTDISASRLSECIRNKSFEKYYVAVICGIPAESEGVYKDLLFKDSSKNKSFVVKKMRKGVKEASLEYKVLDTKETEQGVLSLVLIKLHTGRTHQIRVQFASRKTPLFGDRKYGGSSKGELPSLWSYKLSFPHPISNDEVCFSNLPEKSFPWTAFDYEELLLRN